MRRKWWIMLMSLGCVLAADAEPTNMMSYIDNGKIRLGVDLSKGGAVTYLAAAGGENMINSWDWGRQVQLSFYSGPVPFKPEGATLSKDWEGLGWNPIQSGDTYQHGSKVIEHRNDGKTIRVKCIPMIWPLDNVPAECTFECTYALNGKAVEVTARLENKRSDKKQYSARTQELPAVYVNGLWYKLVTYLGDQPFMGAGTTTLVDRTDNKGWPWISFYSPEHWAALVNSNDHGVGVLQIGSCRLGGGFFGKIKGAGGPGDMQTGYLAPNIDEILDHNIAYEYRYVLVVGSLKEIREQVYNRVQRQKAPKWEFRNDRQHWTYENATDGGWPITNGLSIVGGGKNAAMVSPLTFWRAEDASTLKIDAAFSAGTNEISVMIEPFADQERRDWLCWGPGAGRPPKTWLGPVRVAVKGDGKMQAYSVDMRKGEGYRGAMVRVKIVLPDGAGTARVERVEFE